MNKFDNPFHDLWLTEILSPEEFVQMFSPKIAEHSENLFGPGNVVVRGRQGSGKSMLLRLLDTRTRVAYAQSGELSPIPKKRSFITGSANLTRLNVSAISSRLPREPTSSQLKEVATVFSDFLNYSLALDLLQNLLELGKKQVEEINLRTILQLNLSDVAQKNFSVALNQDQSWYGTFECCSNVRDVVICMRKRLDHYRAYFNFNTEDIDDHVLRTQTEIGEPLAMLADCLRSSGLISPQCLVFFKIDQHEELFELERESGLGDVFRQVINKALAGRDRRSAYRIGTRHYSWSSQVKIWGTAAHLEDLRDYSVIDIDEIFRRPENPKIGDTTYRNFAKDVFRRRLLVAGFEVSNSSKNPIRDVFGSTLSVRKRARFFSIPKDKQKHSLPDEWENGWRELFIHLRETDPLDAKLGEAWLRQKSQLRRGAHLDGSLAAEMPWKNRQWWQKERNEVALMQLASESGQNMFWFGERHIIGLSGWNILAFMSLCRMIWSGWLRVQDAKALEQVARPKIDQSQQVVGVFEASNLWVDKLREGQDGERRRRLILRLGEWFAAKLKRDKALSNPGHNGFSLLRTEFEKNDEINRIIKVCRDYGDLMESAHTSKSRTGKRIKWYLNPILCPYFGLPYVRTKEPIYTDLHTLRRLYSNDVFPDSRKASANLKLFE